MSLLLWCRPKATTKQAKTQWKTIGIVPPNHRVSG